MTDLQMLGNSFANFAWYRRTIGLVPLFDPKVHLFENSLLKILGKLPACYLYSSRLVVVRPACIRRRCPGSGRGT